MLFFYLCLGSILGLIVGYSWRYGITPTPTSAKVKKKLLQILPKRITGQIVELGSGWGTLAFSLAHHFPESKVKAYEISPIPYFISQLISKWLLYPNLHFIRQDFFDISLENATLIVCYLYPGAMNRLKTKFERELKPEAYVLSHTFAIPGWTPMSFTEVNDLYHTPIYLYRVGQSSTKGS